MILIRGTAVRMPVFLATFYLLIAMALSGCGGLRPTYPSPDSVVLENPLPGRALIYFLRAPNDTGSLDILSAGRPVAHMPVETYVALHLPAGEYRFLTMSGSPLAGGQPVAKPLEIVLRPDQRVFFHVSGSPESTIGLQGIIPVRGAGLVPLFAPKTTLEDREWTQCTELDARGLMTISRPVQPLSP